MGLYFFLLCLYRAWLRLDLFIFPMWIINFVDMLNIQMDWVSMRTEIRFFFQLSFSSMSSSHFGFWIVNYILLDSWCICFKNENIVEMSTKLLTKKEKLIQNGVNNNNEKLILLENKLWTMLTIYTHRTIGKYNGYHQLCDVSTFSFDYIVYSDRRFHFYFALLCVLFFFCILLLF